MKLFALPVLLGIFQTRLGLVVKKLHVIWEAYRHFFYAAKSIQQLFSTHFKHCINHILTCTAINDPAHIQWQQHPYYEPTFQNHYSFHNCTILYDHSTPLSPHWSLHSLFQSLTSLKPIQSTPPMWPPINPYLATSHTCLLATQLNTVKNTGFCKAMRLQNI